MNKARKKAFEVQAEGIIKKLKLRKIQGYYCDNVEEAKTKLLQLLGDEDKTVCYGGSVTLEENGFLETVQKKGYNLINREDYRKSDKMKEYKALSASSDAYLMSTNAITLDGELINIDGRGNRVSALIYGPDKVIIIAGMNKVVSNVDDGIRRVRNIASPANNIRIGIDNPCAKAGRCADCLENTICCNIVITRCSMEPDRIQVILVGEDLGY